ncbi:MAG: hypothetical protein HDR23_01055 [Lachnospiraceae bacterium]|nr:hypothetical protein [Lachnospiraceae bacterium]MBD5455064.1 hypothetical protein [Lachnospiraceae bacterium]
MAYNAALNTVYYNYLTSYAPKSTSRYDAHKKSELRNIYNSIIKLNKESPLYFIDNRKETQNYAIGLKENARQLRNTIASLGGLDENQMLNKKVTYSSNEELAEASFIGSIQEDQEIPSYNIEITSLASGQVNIGSFLPSSHTVDLPEDTYSFDVTINDLGYEFQYHVREDETNKEVQHRLARLLTNADIGLNVDVVEDGKGNSALRLTSTAMGLKNEQHSIFYVSDTNTSKQRGSVDYFGIDSVTAKPSNAEYRVNGERRTSPSNRVTIDNMFEVQLKRVSSFAGDNTEIGIKADVDSLTENISDLLDGYNSFIRTTADYSKSYPKSNRLVGEMGQIAWRYYSDFEKMGVTRNENGFLSLDKEILRQAALSDGGKGSLDTIKDFANSILHKTDQVSLNPMQYVEKTIVAYKNPGHNFITPYVTSAYTGMMYNNYC